MIQPMNVLDCFVVVVVFFGGKEWSDLSLYATFLWPISRDGQLVTIISYDPTNELTHTGIEKDELTNTGIGNYKYTHKKTN